MRLRHRLSVPAGEMRAGGKRTQRVEPPGKSAPCAPREAENPSCLLQKEGGKFSQFGQGLR